MHVQTQQIIKTGDSAGRDHSFTAGLRHGQDTVHVRSLHHPVAGDVGVNECLGSFCRQFLGKSFSTYFRGVQPAVCRNITVARINADRYFIAVFCQYLFGKSMIVNRSSTNNNAANAKSEQFLYVRKIAKTAAHLHRNVSISSNSTDNRIVHRMTCFRTI
ncbi:hypothetical protein D3C75_841660 [compost metagenome]